MPDQHGPTRREIVAQLRQSDRKAAPLVWGLRLASYGAMAVAILAYQAGDAKTAGQLAVLFFVGILFTQAIRLKALRRHVAAAKAAEAPPSGPGAG